MMRIFVTGGAGPAKYYANNVVAGPTLLNAMKAAEVDRVVFSSTAAVYGEPERQPIEETAPTQPTNPYGETKLAFEHALRWHYEANGRPALYARLLVENIFASGSDFHPVRRHVQQVGVRPRRSRRVIGCHFEQPLL